ncbi:LtfC-like domain-containing protein [Nocardia sp. NPDC055002]
MADIGIRLDADTLVLWKNRDFKWNFENIGISGAPAPFPPGRLYFELQTGTTPTEWDFVIAGSLATLKVESENVLETLNKVRWQLVFLADGEAAGGDPIARGTVTVIG